MNKLTNGKEHTINENQMMNSGQLIKLMFERGLFKKLTNKEMFKCSDIKPIVSVDITNLNYTDNDLKEYTVKERKRIIHQYGSQNFKQINLIKYINNMEQNYQMRM